MVAFTKNSCCSVPLVGRKVKKEGEKTRLGPCSWRVRELGGGAFSVRVPGTSTWAGKVERG